MHIKLLCVGRIKEKYLKDGLDEYLKRLSRYAKVEITEVNDEKTTEGASDVENTAVKDKEGERILSHIKDTDHVCALAIDGKMYDSEGLAEHLDRLYVSGVSDIAFVIGGSLGLSDAVLKRADEMLSFSKMTFPHQLMRLIFLEQLYRTFRIQKNEPYHK
ncbi:MAG: 23S rRNA (pseudouridine(1915)-N(3))-methyltransferase RlmH [Lachnospiraceae bacterium]|nr:23S rRNA (pseudouridine(1915)-N(3))-methyltransferase RlmH [Lachnospiraceae bacterium]